MNIRSIAAVKEKYANGVLKPNAKSMAEIVEYIEDKWKGERVKIKQSEYVAHYKQALGFMQSLNKDTKNVQEDIRRYHLPNDIYVILGMETGYIMVENGLKYYQALTLLKGLDAEDIETENDRWLQYILLLALEEEWAVKNAEFLAMQEAELTERRRQVEEEA